MASEAELKAAGDKSIPKDYDPALYKIRHSFAHVLAQAVVERFPNAKPTIGPPIEFGFYYDFDIDETPSDADLNWIGNRMRQIIKGKHAFKVREISATEGKTLFQRQSVQGGTDRRAGFRAGRVRQRRPCRGCSYDYRLSAGHIQRLVPRATRR